MGSGPDPPWEGAFSFGGWASHCKVWGHSTVICAKTAERINLPVVDSGGPKEAQVQSYSRRQ